MDCASCSCTSYRYFTSFDKAPTGTCTQSSFDKSSFDKTVPAAEQQMSATVQRMSAAEQQMSSATVQRMSANFQNKAVSKYFWNMYQLMSAAVHVLSWSDLANLANKPVKLQVELLGRAGAVDLILGEQEPLW